MKIIPNFFLFELLKVQFFGPSAESVPDHSCIGLVSQAAFCISVGVILDIEHQAT